VLDRARAIPGVEVASLLGGGLPLRGDLRTFDFGIPGRELPRNTDMALNQIWSEFPDAVPTRIDEQALGYYFDVLVAQRRFNILLLALFGVLGLSIASVGIYGVMAYVVSQRTQEIGIRMALGALPSTILMSVLGSALLTMMVGLAIGLIGAWGLSGLVRAFLFEVQPHDPRVYAGVVLVLSIAGLGAAFGPARRASSVDPLVALRME
jgi:predicted lysophospholipase L1 biosynthesis ABC-type transport system permease subunit